jgi:hypothetical protein
MYTVRRQLLRQPPIPIVGLAANTLQYPFWFFIRMLRCDGFSFHVPCFHHRFSLSAGVDG